ncbi:DUF397 domain-containing protein [Actinomadura hibisca]|uniref:DUF397 domain-containing protein n=1 Tax=Actinomadura hibisca TaxID=68565 RepID=UPI000833A23F|nr:DUF397 domain-containing protein [Actinomadura hibisca]
MSVWRKSSHSSGNDAGSCVEVASAAGGALVRDSKDPDGPRLRLSTSDWQTLLGTVRSLF